MANLNVAINERIRRLAQRECRMVIKAMRKAGGKYRRDIASLKRKVAELQRQLKALESGKPKAASVPAEAVAGARLRVDGLKAHRRRLGLSAKDLGRILGVSGLTVYNWENGKSKPRRSLLPRLVAVRAMGKREAWARLG